MEYYSVKTDCWSLSVPEMHQARCSHSSCSLGTKIYVFGGTTRTAASDSEPLQTSEKIECLDAGTFLSGTIVRWNILDLPSQSCLTTRSRSLMCPISDSELVILGGNSKGTNLADAILLDTSVCTIRQLPELATDHGY